MPFYKVVSAFKSNGISCQAGQLVALSTRMAAELAGKVIAASSADEIAILELDVAAARQQLSDAENRLKSAQQEVKEVSLASIALEQVPVVDVPVMDAPTVLSDVKSPKQGK